MLIIDSNLSKSTIGDIATRVKQGIEMKEISYIYKKSLFIYLDKGIFYVCENWRRFKEVKQGRVKCVVLDREKLEGSMV
jgi:hypothetical protein